MLKLTKINLLLPVVGLTFVALAGSGCSKQEEEAAPPPAAAGQAGGEAPQAGNPAPGAPSVSPQ